MYHIDHRPVLIIDEQRRPARIDGPIHAPQRARALERSHRRQRVQHVAHRSHAHNQDFQLVTPLFFSFIFASSSLATRSGNTNSASSAATITGPRVSSFSRIAAVSFTASFS